MEEKLYTRKEAAEILGVTAGTLSQWALSDHYTIPYTYKGRGRKTFYKPADVQFFLDTQPFFRKKLRKGRGHNVPPAMKLFKWEEAIEYLGMNENAFLDLLEDGKLCAIEKADDEYFLKRDLDKIKTYLK